MAGEPRFDPDSTARTTRRWIPGLLGLALLALPLDGRVAAWAGGLSRRGDFWRELDALQQYGQGVSLVLAAVLVWQLDPPKRGRLADLAAGVATTWVAVFGLKLLTGRPRPRTGRAYGFVWPWDRWESASGSRHAWEFWAGADAEVWSMPSSHAAMAAVLSLFLARTYPGLRGLAVVMAVLVCCGRVAFGAHYPSDVLVGAAVGWGIGSGALRGRWGARAAGAVFRRRRGKARAEGPGRLETDGAGEHDGGQAA